MPNWVTVRVKAENPQMLKEKFTRPLIEGEDNTTECGEEVSRMIDFNVLVPRPKDLDIDSGCCEYLNENHYYKFQKDLLYKQRTRINPVLAPLYDEEVTQEEFVKRAMRKIYPKRLTTFDNVYNLGATALTDKDTVKEHLINIIKGYFNFHRYGYVNWHDFDIQEWGTKWNADTLYEDLEHGYVEFKTAYSCPFPILGKLSEYTPIAVSFSDEDTGNNFGIVTIDKSIVTEHLSCLDYNNADSAEGQLKAIIAAGTIQDGGLENPSMQLFGNDNDEEVADELGVDVETYRKIADETIKETEHLLNTLVFCQ